jgi:hypothetical protein
MFRKMLSARFALAAVALLALDGVAPAQEAAAPQLYLVEAGEVFMVHVAAGSEHAGNAVFILLTTETDPEVALAEGTVVDGRALDDAGLYSGFLTPAAPGAAPRPADAQAPVAPHLMAVVMDARGRLHSSSTLAVPTGAPAGPGGGSSPSTFGPVGPIQPCLIVPPCTGGQLPDLIITNIALNTATTSTGCTGAPLPFVGCPNGRNLTITATIQNIGTCALPCKTPVSIKWGKGLTAGTIVFEFFNQTVQSPALPVGATMTITRSYWMGPCDTVPPWTFHLDFFGAIVDPTNTIAELSETNNTATPVPACNFE